LLSPPSPGSIGAPSKATILPFPNRNGNLKSLGFEIAVKGSTGGSNGEHEGAAREHRGSRGAQQGNMGGARESRGALGAAGWSLKWLLRPRLKISSFFL